MKVSRVTMRVRVIVAVALVTSYWTVAWFVYEAGGDLVHALATPLCLELAALAALDRWDREHDYVALVLFWLPLAGTVVINMAHGYPSHTLMAVYSIPPVAAVGVGTLFLRDQRDAVAREEQAREHEQAQAAARARTRAGTPAVTRQARSNGHKVRTASVAVDTLEDAMPTEADWQALVGEHGTVGAVAAHLDVTRGQVQAHRKRKGWLKA